MPTLLPEWAQQDAILLSWPDEQTDWAPWLTKVQRTYLQLIEAITNNHCAVLLLVRPNWSQKVKDMLPSNAPVGLIIAEYNDTWIRDYGPLGCQQGQDVIPMEFTFNGWGQKFDAALDNAVNKRVLADFFAHPLHSVELVAEGGALEIDGTGQLLSTALCLQNPLRNGELSLDAYRDCFAKSLGATSTHFFVNGHLEGDDTDGHIDTLVRFTPNHGLVIQSCYNRPEDSHFEGLHALVRECGQALPDHQIFELPLPEIFNEAGERLPASYANYLINNGQILAPVYGEPEDAMALDILREAYPDFDIVAIDARPLIQQFGSVHCISMQCPTGMLRGDFLNELKQGVRVYGA